MLAHSRFSRDLAIQTFREFKDENVRKVKLNALYDKFGAREVWFGKKIVGWQVGSDFVCYKKSYKSEQDALLMLNIGQIRSRGRYKASDVYKCPKCGEWHATSKGHLAGTYK